MCRQQPSLRWDLGETRGTVAIRMPDDEGALDLLGRTGPLAVSSANNTGHPAATTADEAEEMLGWGVEVILDGGPEQRLRRLDDRRLHRHPAADPARGCDQRGRADARCWRDSGPSWTTEPDPGDDSA